MGSIVRVALAVPNYMYSKTFLQPPVELLILQKLLRAKGYQATIHDFRIGNLTSDEAIASLPEDTDVIVVSVSPYDMTQMYHMDYRLRYAEHFVRKLKERRNRTVVVAIGAQCSLKPAGFIENTCVDYVVLFEPERTLCELLSTIEGGGDLAQVHNLAIRSDDGTILTEYAASYAHPDLSYFDVVPDWDEVDLGSYYGYEIKKGERERVSSWGVVLASRGCVYGCAYCFNFFSQCVRYRPVESVVKEVKLLERSGAKRLFFLDLTFSQNREWAMALCDRLALEDAKISWICQTRCDCVDETLLGKMRGAGCVGVEFGVESFDDDKLRRLNKGISTTQMRSAIDMCKKYGIGVSAFLMVGTPYESKQSIQSTKQMLKDTSISFIPIVYTPRLGSVLGDGISEEYGVDSWDGMVALRGKTSGTYSVDEMTRDHSILKGESMGGVMTSFENEDLSNDTSHHRSQFSGTYVLGPGETLEEHLVTPSDKHSTGKMPFVSLAITSACPFSCIYCGQGGESTIGPQGIMDIETIMDVAAVLKRQDIKKVRLTGGEPLTHPRFGDILRFLSEQSFYVLVNTNGLLVEDRADALARTSSNIHFAVSLDTLDESRFNAISRSSGCFHKVMRGIDMLCRLGYLMRINMVVGSFNIDEVDDMISFCSAHRCDLKIQEIASVPFPNDDWNRLHADLSTLEEGLASRADKVLVHEYARSFGIPVKVFHIDDTFVTLKSMSNGSRYDLGGFCKNCSHVPCHEGLYDIYVLNGGSIAACRWCTFGSLETLDEDLRTTINAFRNAEYAGPHELTMMARIDCSSVSGVTRL